MKDRAYVFVDGESHFQRSEAAAERMFGNLEALKGIRPGSTIGVPPSDKRFSLERDFYYFWDHVILSPGGHLGEFDVRRAIYVTACTGDETKPHDARVFIRQRGFEPIVLVERKDKLKQRENMRNEYGLIEKPKGCDIALTTRMVADAAADLYQASRGSMKVVCRHSCMVVNLLGKRKIGKTQIQKTIRVVEARRSECSPLRILVRP